MERGRTLHDTIRVGSGDLGVVKGNASTINNFLIMSIDVGDKVDP